MSSNEKPEGPTPGYYRKPHQLRTDTIDLDGTIYKLVDFFADLTFGWGARWVILSQDEIIHGKRRPNGEHMTDLRSGLKEKKSIKKAIDTALELGLIEVKQTRWGTAYAIHRRYWGLMPFAPKWEIFGFIYHDPETDPIPDLSPGGLNPPTDDKTVQIDAATGVWNPPDNNTESTSQYYSTHQTVILKQPAESREVSLQEGPAKGKDTSLNTSSIDKIGKDTLRAPKVARPDVDLENEEEKNEGDGETTIGEATAPSDKIETKRNEAPSETEEEKRRAAARQLEARKQQEALEVQRQARELERLAKVEAARKWQEEQDAKDSAVRPLQHRYDDLVQAKQRAEQGSEAWHQANEELKRVKQELAKLGWYL